jgi:hypothetical protein
MVGTANRSLGFVTYIVLCVAVLAGLTKAADCLKAETGQYAHSIQRAVDDANGKDDAHDQQGVPVMGSAKPATRPNLLVAV